LTPWREALVMFVDDDLVTMKHVEAT